jgi:hypothetical protein
MLLAARPRPASLQLAMKLDERVQHERETSPARLKKIHISHETLHGEPFPLCCGPDRVNDEPDDGR